MSQLAVKVVGSLQGQLAAQPGGARRPWLAAKASKLPGCSSGRHHAAVHMCALVMNVQLTCGSFYCWCVTRMQNGGLQKIADDISRAVKTNCGAKAIVLSHSYGANVMAALFQAPQFTEWR